jgi:short-subunit dehydrogenase
MAQADKNLKQRYGDWALIVGASYGMGSEFAHRLAKQGINCVLLARTESKLNTLKTELETQYGVEVITLTADLHQPGASELMRQAVGDRELGLLVYNAGASPYSKRFVEGDLADWSGLVQMNVQTVIECCYQFGKEMAKRGRGGIILMGSHAAFGGTKKLSVYTASKGFMANFGDTLWIELKDKGVDVLNMLIGTADTPTMRKSMASAGIEITDDMGLGQPKEIVSVALRELANGPTFVFPDDELAGENQPTKGGLRREHVIESTRLTDLFIGDN